MDSITFHTERSKDCETREITLRSREDCEISVSINGESSLDVSKEMAVRTQNSDRSGITESRIPLPSCWDRFSYAQSFRPRIRLYQVWPGKNVFFFRGRMVCGPDPRGFLLTVTSISLSSWIFYTSIKDIPKDKSVVILAFSTVLTVIVFVNLIITGSKDPGIIPRNSTFQVDDTSFGVQERSKRIIANGVEVRLKYCRICNIFQPPRSYHCTICDNCVEKFDHHCPWIGQCIGLRNYRCYIVFIVSAFIFFVYIFSFSCWRIRRKITDTHSGLFAFVASVPETFVMVLFSFFTAWFLGGLIIFHAYLIFKNETTNENLKRRCGKSPNLFDRGMFNNVKEALFSRLPPSDVNFRSVVEPICDSVTGGTNDNAKLVKIHNIMERPNNQIEEHLQKTSEDEDFKEIVLDKY